MLEQEIRAVLEEGESTKVFLNEEEGIWFGGHVRKRNGKPITLSVPNKADLEYIKQAETMMNNPPKKRNISDENPAFNVSQPPTQITYSGILQAHRTQMTQSVSIQETECA